jgi:hypothetical protein
MTDLEKRFEKLAHDVTQEYIELYGVELGGNIDNLDESIKNKFLTIWQEAYSRGYDDCYDDNCQTDE